MRRTTLGPLAPSDLNSSALDMSAVSIGGDVGGGGPSSRKSLSMSTLKGVLGKSQAPAAAAAPGTARKAAASRPSIAPGPTATAGGTDRCVSCARPREQKGLLPPVNRSCGPFPQ